MSSEPFSSNWEIAAERWADEPLHGCCKILQASRGMQLEGVMLMKILLNRVRFRVRDGLQQACKNSDVLSRRT